jgi:hypothetical protein
VKPGHFQTLVIDTKIVGQGYARRNPRPKRGTVSSHESAETRRRSSTKMQIGKCGSDNVPRIARRSHEPLLTSSAVRGDCRSRRGPVVCGV